MRLENEHPDLKRKYEQIVASQERFGFFDQIWVQDTLHPNWNYLLDSNQDLAMRVPFTKKFGVKAYLQPLFLRSLPVFSNSSTDLIQFLQAKSLLHLNLDAPLRAAFSAPIGKYQLLQWQEGIEQLRAGYSDNVKRVLKKARGLTLQSISYSEFQEFFTAQKGENIGNLNVQSWMRLATLCATAQDKEQAFCMGVFNRDELLAVALFFRFKQQLYFMKGTLNKQGKAEGALVFLLDAVLEKYAHECKSLDFVGSNQESIASFYRKFGAKDKIYQIVKGRIPVV
jgi:hypothetical protein